MRIFVFLLLLLTACNFKPKYERPYLEMGDVYRFQINNPGEYVNMAWWKQFEDPTLNYLISVALENNKDLQVATARVLEFYAQYKVVFSQFYPEISAGGNVDRIKLSNDIDFQPPVPGVPRINYLYSLFLKFSYELDFWGSIRNQTEAAKSQYLSQVYARQNVILSLVTSVATAYILLKQYWDQLEISKLTYESRKKSWDIANLRFDAGLVSELEVKQAESETLGAETQIKNFEVLIAKQEDLISVLLGQAPGPIREGLRLSEMNLPPCVPTGLPCDLLENRPDIKQAEEQILAANADVGVARAAFFPTFTLDGDLGQKSTATNNFFNNSANFFDFVVQAFQPLFTGWRLTNQLNEAEAVLLETLYSYQQTILTALQEVDDALIAHKKAKEKYQIQTQRVGALKDYLNLANLRYFNGQNDYLTVLDAEKTLFATQLEASTTEADLYLTIISLYKALGQGWDVEEPEIETDESEPVVVENKF
ncbi:MAG: efflux transporter outer membrane subunit [Parachlamydiales bacterium]|nr:efflux transporter outer membrane subunit [Parachlamydiales bacterium]